MSGLTPVQIQAMRYIEDYSDLHGFVPTYQEIADFAGLASKSGAYRLVNCLEARGYVRRTPGGARAMEIVRRLSGPARPRIDGRVDAYEATLRLIAGGAVTDPADAAATVLGKFGASA